MVLITVRVSPFSRKILLAENGGTMPVAPAKADWLSDVLRIDRRDTNFRLLYIEALTTEIQLEVPERLAAQLHAQGDRIGVVLHRLHLEQLSRHMISARLMQAEVKKALRQFYDYYDISEDDFSEESAYREYQRFRRLFFRENAAKSATKTQPVVTRKSRIWQPEIPESQRPTLTHLRALISHFADLVAEQRYRRHYRLMRQAACYIYTVRGGLSNEKVCKHTGRHRASVFRALAAVRKRMKKDKEFARMLHLVCDESFVLPEAAPADHLCLIEATDARPSNPEPFLAEPLHASATHVPKNQIPGSPGFDFSV